MRVGPGAESVGLGRWIRVEAWHREQRGRCALAVEELPGALDLFRVIGSDVAALAGIRRQVVELDDLAALVNPLQDRLEEPMRAAF